MRKRERFYIGIKWPIYPMPNMKRWKTNSPETIPYKLSSNNCRIFKNFKKKMSSLWSIVKSKRIVRIRIFFFTKIYTIAFKSTFGWQVQFKLPNQQLVILLWSSVSSLVKTNECTSNIFFCKICRCKAEISIVRVELFIETYQPLTVCKCFQACN